MSQHPYAPPPPKPPLPRRARNGAWIAGAVAFSVLSLGWTLLFAAVVIALVGGFFLWFANLLGGRANDAAGEAFLDFFASIDVSAIVPLLIIGAAAGLVLMALALFLSRWILGAHQVDRPWAVTWAGSGIAIVGGWIIGSVVSAAAQVVASFAAFAPDPISAGIAGASVSGLLAIVLTATIGLLSWWWMAHLMRSREPRADPGGG